MKNTLITGILCSMLILSTSPSLAQLAGPVNPSASSSSTSSSSSGSSAASQFTAPNYWGDSRIKDRSSASSSQASSSGIQQGGRSKGGGGGSGMGMMGPAMMLPMMLMGRGFGRGGRQRPPKQKEDEQKQDKHHSKHDNRAQQQAMNNEIPQGEPFNTQQAMNPLSQKTFDLQNGNAIQAPEGEKKVSGIVQDEEGQAPGTDF